MEILLFCHCKCRREKRQTWNNWKLGKRIKFTFFSWGNSHVQVASLSKQDMRGFAWLSWCWKHLMAQLKQSFSREIKHNRDQDIPNAVAKFGWKECEGKQEQQSNFNCGKQFRCSRWEEGCWEPSQSFGEEGRGARRKCSVRGQRPGRAQGSRAGKGSVQSDSGTSPGVLVWMSSVERGDRGSWDLPSIGVRGCET